MDTLYLVMPAYNEAENIETTIASWYPVLEGKGENSRLVVADSGSTDSTHQILTGLQQKYPKLEIAPPIPKKNTDLRSWRFMNMQSETAPTIFSRQILTVRPSRRNFLPSGSTAKGMMPLLGSALPAGMENQENSSRMSYA